MDITILVQYSGVHDIPVYNTGTARVYPLGYLKMVAYQNIPSEPDP